MFLPWDFLGVTQAGVTTEIGTATESCRSVLWPAETPKANKEV